MAKSDRGMPGYVYGTAQPRRVRVIHNRHTTHLAGHQTDIFNTITQCSTNDFDLQTIRAGNHHRGTIGKIAVAPKIVTEYLAQLGQGIADRCSSVDLDQPGR